MLLQISCKYVCSLFEFTYKCEFGVFMCFIYFFLVCFVYAWLLFYLCIFLSLPHLFYFFSISTCCYTLSNLCCSRFLFVKIDTHADIWEITLNKTVQCYLIEFLLFLLLFYLVFVLGLF